MDIKKERSDILLSIIVPVYNAEEYLKDCLDSCLEQSLDKNLYEIICIDDGSTDGSGEILDDYERKYSNFSVVHKNNEGVSIARNNGIDLAKGKYIWFVDSDDMIHPNCLQSISIWLKEYKPDAIYIKMIIGSSVEWQKEEDLRAEILSRKFPVRGVPEAIVSTDLLLKHQLRFNPDFIIGEDQLFHLYFYLYSSGTILSVNQGIYFYRMHGDSTIHSVDYGKRAENSLRLAFTMLNEAKRWKGENLAYSILRERAYAFIWYTLYFLPKSNLNHKEVLSSMRKYKLKLPFLWALPEGRKTLKWRLKKLVSRLFSIRPIYFLYYQYAKRKYTGGQNNHRN